MTHKLKVSGAKVDHICELCGEKIPAGDVYYRLITNRNRKYVICEKCK